MPSTQNPTRQRLIRTALELFAQQGVTATTTRQISDSAGVNEVTLFRHFGSKHGLLLAVIEEAAVFTQLGQTLVRQANQTGNIYQALKDYATACLQALDRVPEVVRSVVGESGSFPAENREALGRGVTQANRYVAEYFETVIDRGHLHTYLSAEKLASLLHGMLLGYAVIEFTSEFHDLWQDREDFLENLVTLFLHGAVSSPVDLLVQPAEVRSTVVITDSMPKGSQAITDLPAYVVHSLLQKAKKAGAQDYAIAYVLFGTGLSPAELIGLERSHYYSDPNQSMLYVGAGRDRQRPVNQWIMGKRYGSYTRNPLTQWLKSRKDQQSALFVDPADNPMSESELQRRWQTWTADLSTPDGQPIQLTHAQQTWCVEMLMRGMSLENLSILMSWDLEDLRPFADRAREKAALEEAMRLDQKN